MKLDETLVVRAKLTKQAFQRSLVMLADNEYWLLKGRLPPNLKENLHRNIYTAMVLSHKTGVKNLFDDAGLLLESVPAAVAWLDKRISAKGVAKRYDLAALRMAENVTQKVQNQLVKVQRQIIADNLHVKGGVEELKKVYDVLGITPRNAYTIENVYRTQVSLAWNAGKYQAEQAPEIQDILWGYTYSGVLDDRERDEHLKIEGVSLPKEHPFWEKSYPPNGWSCRCIALPEYEPQTINRPPRLWAPDEGFDMNFGKLFR